MKLYFSANELSEIVLMSRFAEYVKESLGLRDDSLKNVVLILSLFLFLWYSFYKEKKIFFFYIFLQMFSVSLVKMKLQEDVTFIL